jgi:hypothetical protein
MVLQFLGGVEDRSIHFRLETLPKKESGGCEVWEMWWPRDVINCEI